MRRPNFFIVGAPKSGTSAMYTYLAQHPDVYMSPRKEPHFFGADLHRINHTPLTLEEYTSFFADAGGEAIIGEASTSYLQSRTAAREIKTFAPAARILIMLRHPVDVMYAYHGTHLYSGFETIVDFEAALAAEGDRQAGRYWPSRPGIADLLFYRDVVRYSEQVERYFAEFGRDAVRVLLYDDVQRDTARTYGDVVTFLGVSPDFVPSFTIVNPSRRLRSRKLQRFLREPAPFFQRLIGALVPAAARRMFVARMTRLNTSYERRPPLDPAVRRRLLSELAPSIERLSKLIDRDLSSWIQDAPPQRSGTPLPLDRSPWPPVRAV